MNNRNPCGVYFKVMNWKGELLIVEFFNYKLFAVYSVDIISKFVYMVYVAEKLYYYYTASRVEHNLCKCCYLNYRFHYVDTKFLRRWKMVVDLWDNFDTLTSEATWVQWVHSTKTKAGSSVERVSKSIYLEFKSKNNIRGWILRTVVLIYIPVL